MATREQIDDLKRQWRADPCWDIEETEGFEEHREELREYHEQVRAEGELRREAALIQKSEELGCPGNTALAAYIERLEKKIDDLAQFVGAI